MRLRSLEANYKSQGRPKLCMEFEHPNLTFGVSGQPCTISTAAAPLVTLMIYLVLHGLWKWNISSLWKWNISKL